MSDGRRKLRVPDEVAGSLGAMHPEIKRKIRAALRSILDDPNVGKPLRGELAGLRTFRVGRLRIVFRHQAGGVIEVVAVGPRREIYDDTYRRVLRERGTT